MENNSSIKEGEFFRTEKGEIVQINKIFETAEEQVRFYGNVAIARCNFYGLKQILLSKQTAEKGRHSFNIMDLLSRNR